MSSRAWNRGLWGIGVLSVAAAFGCENSSGGAAAVDGGTDADIGTDADADADSDTDADGDSDTDADADTDADTDTDADGDTDSDSDTDAGTGEDFDGRAYQPLTLDFEGPAATELDDGPNPFLDYRMIVTFEGPDGASFEVPGFFDGDGVGGASGDVWRARFTPDRAGDWSYEVSFEQGDGLAVEPRETSGTPLEPDGEGGALAIGPPDPDAPGTYAKGLLRYASAHYLRFLDGDFWLKGGADSPENFLAYSGFDGTTSSAVHLHDYAEHEVDWETGDPDWGGGAGRGIVGALNYLAEMRVNSIYLLTMNIGGDGKDVWPFAGAVDGNGSSSNDNLHYDVSKLAQWEIVFDHAQRKGIALHFVLNEAETANKTELDGGELGVERKLYYRELIARFGHHNALHWNLSEEYDLNFDFGEERIAQFAAFIREQDPYDHPLTVHNAFGLDEGFAPFLGSPSFDLTSFQVGFTTVDGAIETWREASAEAGRPWCISIDEFTVDMGQALPWEPVYSPDDYRKLKTWATYLSGGQLEFILPECLTNDDFRAYEQLWTDTWNARKLVEALPFSEMAPMDSLLSGAALYSNGEEQGFLGGQVFAKAGVAYAVYLPNGSETGTLDLTSDTATFTGRWYNPRTGAFEGDTATVTGGSPVPLGTPPSAPEEDWLYLLDDGSTAPAE